MVDASGDHRGHLGASSSALWSKSGGRSRSSPLEPVATCEWGRYGRSKIIPPLCEGRDSRPVDSGDGQKDVRSRGKHQTRKLLGRLLARSSKLGCCGPFSSCIYVKWQFHCNCVASRLVTVIRDSHLASSRWFDDLRASLKLILATCGAEFRLPVAWNTDTEPIPTGP